MKAENERLRLAADAEAKRRAASRAALEQLVGTAKSLEFNEHVPGYVDGSTVPMPAPVQPGKYLNDRGEVVSDPSMAKWTGTQMIGTDGVPVTRKQPKTAANIMAMLESLRSGASGLVEEDQAALGSILEALARQGRGAPTGGKPAAAGGASTATTATAAAGQPSGTKTATMAEISAKTREVMQTDHEMAALGFDKAQQKIIERLRAANYIFRP